MDTKSIHLVAHDNARMTNPVHEKSGAIHHFDPTKAGTLSLDGSAHLSEVGVHSINYIECIVFDPSNVVVVMSSFVVELTLIKVRSTLKKDGKEAPRTENYRKNKSIG